MDETLQCDDFHLYGLI